MIRRKYFLKKDKKVTEDNIADEDPEIVVKPHIG
jgi:hypothetical protein